MEEAEAAEAEAPVAAPAAPEEPEVVCNVDEACVSGSATPLPATMSDQAVSSSGMVRIAAMADFQRVGWRLTTSLSSNVYRIGISNDKR